MFFNNQYKTIDFTIDLKIDKTIDILFVIKKNFSQKTSILHSKFSKYFIRHFRCNVSFFRYSIVYVVEMNY